MQTNIFHLCVCASIEAWCQVMKKFLEEMGKNQELKAKIEELDKNPESTPEDYIQAAAEYGIELKEEDFKAVDRRGELSDDELDAVAGGSVCVCVVGGGGSSSDADDTCACVLGGGGSYSSRATETGPRCGCAWAGGGSEGTVDCRRSGY